MATPKLMPERLRLAAARCIVHGTPNWWSTDMTDEDEFREVNYFEQLLSSDNSGIATPEDAANLLLLVAEALDE
ncbi:hypothetical protein [Variovorax sp. V15]|uniref:hypothetical protein n=1 Tax=Variovorax sp. V15 TaxID=3065952 RepID=UPI0034E8B192